MTAAEVKTILGGGEQFTQINWVISSRNTGYSKE